MKGINSLKGAQSVRTMSTTRKRSIPGCMNSNYLELFMLEKEKERLLMERNRLSLKMDVVHARLEEMEIEINRLRKVEGLAETSQKKKLEKAKEENAVWKTVSIKY